MNLDDLFAHKRVLSTPDIARAFDMSENDVRSWATELHVALIGQSFAWTRSDAESLLAAVDARRGPQSLHPSEPASLGRLGYSIAEAARALGKKPDALRRMIEHHAREENGEKVARLTGGIVARKTLGYQRWLVVIPKQLVENA